MFIKFDFSYVIPENVRHMLYQYNHNTALYFGHRYAVQDMQDGYMAGLHFFYFTFVTPTERSFSGGGYILSKAALEKFVTRILPNKTLCRQDSDGAEDYELGKCLEHFAIPVDERDELSQKRFFPVGTEEHFKTPEDPEYWYVKNQYYKSHHGGLDCCSDTPIAFHYVDAKAMYYMDYLINNVHPFGLDKNITEKLPEKLKLEDIMTSSNADSLSPNFKKHKFVHGLDQSENY